MRPFSRKYWQERQILYAAEQRRKRWFWLVIGAFFVLLFAAIVIGLSVTGRSESPFESIIMTGG